MKVTFEELMSFEYWNKIGYVPGLGRLYQPPKKSHLYRGTYSAIGDPLCKHGWNRQNGEGFSIWRNNIGKDGICLTCIKIAKKEIMILANKKNEP